MSAEAVVPQLHRSYLYAPGSCPDLMAKAVRSGSDAVVMDLEDAVAAGDRPGARRAVADAIAAAGSGPCDVHVRVPRAGEGWSADDVAAVVVPGLDALRLPKAEEPAAVRALDERLADLERRAGMPEGSVRLYPTVESAVGALRLGELLGASPRCARAAFGASDFLADVGARGEDDLATLHVRSAMVLTSRAAAAGPPIDSVHTALEDDAGLRRAAERARSLGFVGKSVIHPRQVPVVHDVFTPDGRAIAWAERVVAAVADGRAAATVEGEFVDAAVVARAHRVLALARSTGG